MKKGNSSLIQKLNLKIVKIILIIIVILILSYWLFMISNSLIIQGVIMIITCGFIFMCIFRYYSTKEKYLKRKLRKMQLQCEEITDKIKEIKKELKHKKRSKLEKYYN